MDLSALVLNQSQNGQLKLSGKSSETEGESGVAGGFLKTLSEQLGEMEGGNIASPSHPENELLANAPEISHLGGNELPLREEKLNSDFVEATNLAVLSEPIAMEASSTIEVPSALFTNGIPGNLPIDSVNREQMTAVEPATLFKMEREEQAVMKTVGDFLQEREVKAKTVTEPSALSALKPTVLPTVENEPRQVTLGPLSSDLSQTVAGKEQLSPMSRPIGHPEWGRELGERISWMAGKTIQTAELRLNPAKLGPVEVHVQINQDQASVMFNSPHAAVREALEQALPRLREMMTAQQFEQVNIDISHQSSGERQASHDSLAALDDGSPFLEADGEEEAVVGSSSSHTTTGEGLLSYYV